MKIKVILLIILPLCLINSGCIINWVGGNYNPHRNLETAPLSEPARLLVNQIKKELKASHFLDFHIHLICVNSQAGCYINPQMMSLFHPVRYMQFLIYKSASGITDMEEADAQYLKRLKFLAQDFKGLGKFTIFSFDKYYHKNGDADLSRTGFHVPNEYMYNVYKQNPLLFEPVISVHPYRHDAVERLDFWSQKGVKFVKWLPNSMGIDPADPQIKLYYLKLIEKNMILITHTGEEKAVHAEEAQELGNPLRLRYPLNLGVKILAAHLSSLGESIDLDDPGRNKIHSFNLLLRLMRNPKYNDLLFADISAITFINRLDKIEEMLSHTEIMERVRYGSDYPLPAIKVLTPIKKFVNKGLLTPEDKSILDELYIYNPIFFDIALKKLLKDPKTGKPIFQAIVFSNKI